MKLHEPEPAAGMARRTPAASVRPRQDPDQLEIVLAAIRKENEPGMGMRYMVLYLLLGAGWLNILLCLLDRYLGR